MVIGSSLADSYFNQLETYRRVWMDLTPAAIDSVVFIAAYAYGMSKLKRLRKTDAETPGRNPGDFSYLKGRPGRPFCRGRAYGSNETMYFIYG